MNYLKNTSPKPWHVKNIDHIDSNCPPWFEIKDRNKCTIATIESEYYSDAALIAAAPTLYNALAELHLAVTMRPSGGLSQQERAALDFARAAIAKVRNDQTIPA